MGGNCYGGADVPPSVKTAFCRPWNCFLCVVVLLSLRLNHFWPRRLRSPTKGNIWFTQCFFFIISMHSVSACSALCNQSLPSVQITLLPRSPWSALPCVCVCVTNFYFTVFIYKKRSVICRYSELVVCLFHCVALKLVKLKSSVYRLSIETCVRFLFAHSVYSSLLWFYAFFVQGPKIKWHSEKRLEPSAAFIPSQRDSTWPFTFYWINTIVEGFSSWPWHRIIRPK